MKPSRKKPPTVHYPGPLGEPHAKTPSFLFGGLLGPPVDAEEEARKRDLEALAKKVDLLVDHYDARSEGGDVNWKSLAISLAFSHVPGFQIVETPKRKRGRPRNYDGFDLYRAILKVLDEKRTSVANACVILSRRNGAWHGKKPTTLETRFHADKRKLASRTFVGNKIKSEAGTLGGLLGNFAEVDDRPSAKYPPPPLGVFDPPPFPYSAKLSQSYK